MEEFGDRLVTVVSRATSVAPDACRVTLRAPLDHQSNRLYDVMAGDRHFIAKEFLKPKEFLVAPAREFRALQLLEPLDVAPRPVFFDPGIGPIIVYEYLEGAMWDRRRPMADELAKLAKLWLIVGAVPTDGLWMSRGYEHSLTVNYTELNEGLQRYADWTASEFPSGCRAADMCLELAEARDDASQVLEALPPSLCFCRSDPRFANVISRPDGRLGMVDWEDSGLRDPARDVADLLTHANQEDLLSPKDWEAFLQPYLGAGSIADPSLSDRVHLYLAIFPLFWLAVLLSRGVSRANSGKLGGWTINGLPANDRLRRYLARAIAWPDPNFDNQLAMLADVVFFP